MSQDNILYELDRVRDGTYNYLSLENPLVPICPCCASRLRRLGGVHVCEICENLYTAKALVIIDFLLWFGFDDRCLAADRFSELLDAPARQESDVMLQVTHSGKLQPGDNPALLDDMFIDDIDGESEGE